MVGLDRLFRSGDALALGDPHNQLKHPANPVLDDRETPLHRRKSSFQCGESMLQGNAPILEIVEARRQSGELLRAPIKSRVTRTSLIVGRPANVPSVKNIVRFSANAAKCGR